MGRGRKNRATGEGRDSFLVVDPPRSVVASVGRRDGRASLPRASRVLAPAPGVVRIGRHAHRTVWARAQTQSPSKTFVDYGNS